MGQKIEFPLNGQTYLKQARALFVEDKLEDAIRCAKKAYELDQETETNRFYVHLLATAGKFEEALEIMNLEKEYYKSDEYYTSYYVNLLIKNNKFIEAEYLIQKYKKNAEGFHAIDWNILEQELINKRNMFNLEESQRNIQTKKSLAKLEQYPLMEQARYIHEASNLELSDLQELAPLIISNSNISGDIQRGYLEVLVQKRDSHTYLFPWFGEMRKVCPADLLEFEDIPIVRELTPIIEKKLHKHMDLHLLVKMEILNGLLLLYPYVEEVVTDLSFWIDSYITELDDLQVTNIERISVNQEQQEMKKWIKKLMKFSD